MSEVDRPAEDFRAWSRTQWGELGEKAAKVLAVALDAKKTIRRTIVCSSCGVRQQKEIQVGDARIALDALGWLTESGFGRAPTAKDEAASAGHVFVYKVVHPPMGCVDCECEKCVGVEAPGVRGAAPGEIWVLHDRRDGSDAVFRTRSDLLAYVETLDERPDSE